jgi:DNA uptake protein ComE-like DNA-binding protein
MSWKQFVKDYLVFTRKDRIAGIVVLTLIAGIYAIPKLLSSPVQTASIIPNDVLKNALDTVEARRSRPQNFYNHEDERSNNANELSVSRDFTEGALFLFNPNTLNGAGWQRLGLGDRQVKTIMNYRNKGGRFYKSEDLKKIWGLPEGFYERVAPYIELENKSETAYKPAYAPSAVYEKKVKDYSIADLNTADTSALIALPGIGSKLATRINSFRDKLGGFYSVAQVGETYGLADSTFQKIKPFLQVDETSIKKLNINMVTKDDLKGHPYIRWNLANAIVEYRAQHGAYKSLEELKNIVLVDEATFEKIRHYLSLGY